MLPAARHLSVLVLTMLSTGCAAAPAEPETGIVCSDGYTAHPDYGHDERGCGPHGGVSNPFEDELDAYFEAYPDGPPSRYVCADGWQSTAVYQQGACSHHGGVAEMSWPDGSHVSLNGPSGIPVLTLPDGSTTQIPLPDPTD